MSKLIIDFMDINKEASNVIAANLLTIATGIPKDYQDLEEIYSSDWIRYRIFNGNANYIVENYKFSMLKFVVEDDDMIHRMMTILKDNYFIELVELNNKEAKQESVSMSIVMDLDFPINTVWNPEIFTSAYGNYDVSHCILNNVSTKGFSESNFMESAMKEHVDAQVNFMATIKSR